jgi:hypothetical protein
VLCFALLDAVVGAVAKATSDHSFRVEHPYYHHGLRPNTRTETTWGGRRYPMRTDSLGFRSEDDDEVRACGRPDAASC